MLKDRGKRLATLRRRTLLIAAMALMVPMMALAAASPAMAEPKGIFKIFNQCPTEIPGVTLCQYQQTTSGEFAIGTTKVPINQTITLQGGGLPTGNEENPREFFTLPAKNGESISKTELNVPGGITGLIKCEEITGSGIIETFFRELCKHTLETGATQLTATAEIVASATNPAIFNEFALAREEGTAVTLPMRVHLKNPLLGNGCYIGSEASPLQLHLTTGATHPPSPFTSIHGKLGEPETREEKGLVTLRVNNNTLVDNNFSAPGSTGCGEFFGIKGFLNFLVNGKAKIPNKAGENTVKLTGQLNAASAEEVILSEKF